MRATAVNKVHELAERDERVVFIGSDLGAGTLEPMRQAMPERFFMEGVAEANMVGMAAGMAMEGFVPYLNTIATFFTRRALEQICVDLCLHDLPVRMIANGGGLVYAPLGPTHLATDDIALMRALPRMTIVAPCDATEMAKLMDLSLDLPGPLYVRCAKGHDPLVSDPDRDLVIGQAVLMRAPGDVLLVSTGVATQNCLAAIDSLAAQGIAAGLLHYPTIKPFDAERLRAAAEESRLIVVVEEHSRIGGLGSAALEALYGHGAPPRARLVQCALPDEFADDYGSQQHLMARYGIDAAGIAGTVEKNLDPPSPGGRNPA